MSIEQNIERIANALEKLASGAVDLGLVVKAAEEVIDSAGEAQNQVGPEAPAPKPPKRVRKPKPEAATVDNVREALRVFLKDNEAAEAAAILAEFGSPSVTALDPQHYAAVLGRLAA
ncbi:MAG: hypothetical protein V3T08_09975 [Gemmatimonadota bacterium]